MSAQLSRRGFLLAASAMAVAPPRFDHFAEVMRPLPDPSAVANEMLKMMVEEIDGVEWATGFYRLSFDSTLGTLVRENLPLAEVFRL
jgi:hypothetical protein